MVHIDNIVSGLNYRESVIKIDTYSMAAVVSFLRRRYAFFSCEEGNLSFCT